MMSDPTTVDQTTVDELTGKLVLLIEEPRAWDEPALMHRQLAAKVKNYVRHVRSEEYSRAPSETIVRLVSEHRPGAASIQFFGRVSYELSKHALAFEYQVGSEGLPVPIPPEAGAAAPSRAQRAAPPRQPSTEPGGTKPRADAAAPPTEPTVPPSADISEADEPTGTEPPGDSRPTQPGEPPTRKAEDVTSAETAEPGAAEPWVPEIRTAEEEEEIEVGPEPSASTGGTAESEIEAAATESAESGAAELEIEAAPTESAESGAAELEIESLSVEPADTDSPEQVEELVSQLESLARPKAERPKYPPFFPEEEFGRAVPGTEVSTGDAGEIEIGEPEFETPVIETTSGKKILMDTTPVSSREKEARPGLLRALGSSLGSALAGALVWALLAIPADQGASPLALALALMVGMSVRVRGGRSFSFRLVAGAATLLGSILGAVLATVVLTAKHSGGVSALPALADPAALADALLTYFGLLDVAFVAVAVYIAMRLAVAKR